MSSRSLRTKLKPGSLRLTKRDLRILESIHAFDGILSLKQIDHLFFSGLGRSQVRARLRALRNANYVRTPTSSNLHKVPFGESVFWLAPAGAQLVAQMHNIRFKEFSWHKRPRLSQISHDLRVNDIRIRLTRLLLCISTFNLDNWYSESHLQKNSYKVSYRDSLGRANYKSYVPDGVITCHSQASDSFFSFILEVDMATQHNPRFFNDKVIRGLTYLANDQFYKQFGVRYARWLIITTSAQKRANLVRTTARSPKGHLFYFATFQDFMNHNPLLDPIFWVPNQQHPQPMIPHLELGSALDEC